MVLRVPMLLNGEFRDSPNIGKEHTYKMVWDQWSSKPQRPFSHGGSQTLTLCSKAGSGLGRAAD